jgi:phage regulator Rha-like protein
MAAKRELIPVSRIAPSIHFLRGPKVMLSRDLADLYGVRVKVLNQAVKRHSTRFPADFVFQLNSKELENLKSQFVTSSRGGIRRARPYAFTEQGVAMLSSVLNSARAVRVNIAIMRAFVRLREIVDAKRELGRHFSQLEARVGKHDEEIAVIIDAIRQLMTPSEKPRREIGFHVREKSPRYRTRNHR